MAANESRRHLRVREDALAAQALALEVSRSDDSLADGRGTLTFVAATVGQILEPHGRHVNVDVYPIHERPRDAPDVTLNLQRRAATFARRVVKKSARARIHRRR